jgi:hypothetical protein
MPATNMLKCKMYNFTNKYYLELLKEILGYFEERAELNLSFDDTMIRYDYYSQEFIASVYVLEY